MIYESDKDKSSKTINKRLIILVSLAVVLVAGIIVAAFLFIKKDKVTDTNVVAEVAGEKIYLDEYKERLFAAQGGLGSPKAPLVYEATGGIKESVLNDVAELKVIDKELAKRNITISDEELAQEARNVFKDYRLRDVESQKAYRKYVRLKIGRDRLMTGVVSWKEGYVLYCYFHRADMDDFINKPEASTKKQTDKAYAQDYCSKAQQRLETGQSDFQNELAKVKADPQIGENAWKPYYMAFGLEIKKDSFTDTPSPAYDLSNRLSELGNDKGKYYLLTLQDKPSQPQNGGGAGSVELDTQGTANANKESNPTSKQKEEDALFAVVFVKDGHKGEADNFKKWLEERKQEYSVKTYIERINL